SGRAISITAIGNCVTAAAAALSPAGNASVQWRHKLRSGARAPTTSRAFGCFPDFGDRGIISLFKRLAAQVDVAGVIQRWHAEAPLDAEIAPPGGAVRHLPVVGIDEQVGAGRLSDPGSMDHLRQ